MEDRIRAVMADIFMVDLSEIGPGTSMASLAPWDSLAQINLIAALEDEFDIDFAVEEFETMIDFPSVLKTVGQKM